MNSKKIFKINRSSILENILIDKGWKEANEDDNIDFSYYYNYKKGNIKEAKIRVIPRKITNIIDSKNKMYLELKKHNLTAFLPNTYTDLKNINPNIFNDDKIFFLKEVNGSGGTGVYVINSLETMNHIINKKDSNYILQENVPNMLFLNGHKTTLRVYILITDKKNIYVHKDILGIIHNTKYNSKLDRNIHINHNDVDYYNLKDIDDYNNIFEKIKDISFLVCRCFIANSNIMDNEYIILGADIILDNNNNPYLIEINAYPNLWSSNKLVHSIKMNMLTDFVNLYIEPIINNIEPKQGNWVLCNPLHTIGNVQKTLQLEFEKNLYQNIKNFSPNKNNSFVISTDHFNKLSLYDYNSIKNIIYTDHTYLNIVSNRLNMYYFMKNNNILYLSPKTYIDINNINETNEKKIFYIKNNTGCAQNGIYFGDINYIRNKFNINKDKCIIQENVENPLLYKGKKIIFGFYYLIIDNKIKFCETPEHIAVNCENNIYGDNPEKIVLSYNIIQFKNLENYDKILKNILTSVKQFFKYYIQEIKQTNTISLHRMDIIVDDKYTPYILEVNCHQLGLTHNKCYCGIENGIHSLNPLLSCVDYNICKDLYFFYIDKYIYKSKYINKYNRT